MVMLSHVIFTIFVQKYLHDQGCFFKSKWPSYTPVLQSVQCPWREKKSDSIFKVWKCGDRKWQVKGKGTHICISLDQAIVSCRICGPQRMFVNCLPSIDLEFRFLGTIFCEMDDLDQALPKQTRIHSPALEKWAVLAYFYISKSTFGCINL